MNYPQSNFKNISEIHHLSPFFVYTNKISSNGMNKHFKFLTYDHYKNEVVDVSDIVSKSFNKKCTQIGVLFSGVGIDAQSEYFERFMNAYQTLTGKNFEGNLNKFLKNEKTSVSKEVNKFLELKENKLKYATAEQQNDAKFVYETVKYCGCAIKYASTRLKNDKIIALAAITDDNTALRFVGKKIKDDENYIRLAMDNYPNGHLWASQRIIENIGKNDPVKYLDNFILHQKLEQNISDKPAVKKTKI